MSRNLRQFTRAVFGFDAVVQRADPGAWDRPSPCEGWTARDVLQHQLDAHTAIAAFAWGEKPPAPPKVTDDPVGTWNGMRDTLLSSLDQQGSLQRIGETPFGTMPVDQLIGLVGVDPLTHTWDLALAVGERPVLDEQLAAHYLEGLQALGEAIRSPQLFGPEVEIADDADVVSRFLAYTGRHP